ncbi:nuclear pore membrane glycoprotein 210 isoform X1 [Vespa velutina]|uniref:nuclear pore membrane glycoprotein 210 isoform X1 n=1 Tax=Vespa velutina TaxID=202808 RepID=UPI001FB227B7|nr:nuclear pore membrane glycoprotein 210 isoform X1 [Vespa velutina]
MEGKRSRRTVNDTTLSTADMVSTVFFLFIFLLCATKDVTTHRLNVPRVLLPVFNDFAINFTLEVTDGGCYQWSTSRLDIIQLIPISENFDKSCSSSIMIQTITRESTRNTAIVLAEDVNTGQLLRCDVIVDAIFSLNLVTTTRELYIEEAPEAFEVRAYDEQGNEFTTLAGVEFLWNIGNADKRTQSDNKIPGNVLRFLTYQESQYETPLTVIDLDAAGKKGHIVLLEGIRTGTAKVSVKLPYPEYKHVPPIEVELIVIANLIIIPSEVTMMQYDNFKYKIMQVHQGRLEIINLPSSQYYLEAENPDMLKIDNDISTAYALLLGRTKVFLHDKNVRDEYPVILPSAVVNVNTVTYISLAVLPNRNWGLILGQMHEIIVELYDNKDHKFHIGDGIEVSIKVDENYFDPKFVSQNGTYLVGVPITCGTMLVQASLYGITDKYGKKIALPSPLSTEAELVIHTPVTIRPHVLAVPWDSKSKSRYDIALKANGGDGSYVWISRHSSIVTVSQSGGIRILAPGSSEVIVAMSRNQYNKDTAKIHVLPPSKLKIIEYSIEAAVGEPIHLHIALYGKLTNGSDSKEIPFNDCRDINFETFIPDGNFAQNFSKDVQPIGVSCAVITIISSSVGISQVTVAYNANGQYLTDNITVSAYEPLIVVHPKNKETLLAVGSSRKIIFKGGPHPWSSKPQSYSRKMQSSNEKIAEIIEHTHSLSISYDISVFEVLCKALGEVILTYTVSNVPLLPNCKTTYAVQTTRVTCGKPRYIYLQPEVKDSNSCPLKQNSDKILAHSDKSQKFIIMVKDEDGRQFDNITSLNIEWNIKPSAAGHMEISTGSVEETFTDMQVVLPKRHYQNIIFTKRFGIFTICAIITGYQKHILGKLRITPEWPAFPVQNDKGIIETPLIENCVEITLVNDTILSPNKLIILNDPNGKYYLQVNQGSGYYEFILSSNDVADVRYMEPTKVISVTPKKAGTVHIALRDLCLPSKEAEAIIEVQQLAIIETDVINKIEKGKCVIAALKLLDTNGNVIKLPSLNALNFKAKYENKYIEIKQLSLNEHGNPPYDQMLYKVSGVNEGESQLTFVSEAHEQEIQSEPISIQVFLPLKIHPKNLTILIGTIYQIQTIGGPTNAEIEFSTKNNEILSIDHNGVFEGKSNGQTKIIARAIGINAKGNKIIYSEDYTTIHVLYLEGIKIVTPVTRVKVGGTFPLWAFGIPEYLTPLIIGSMQLPLSFSWSSSDSTLLSLHNMYEGTGINIRYQNEVSIRARALEAGLITIYLNVTVPSNVLTGLRNEMTYTTFVKIEIFEELHLINPALPSGSSVILMSPNSMLKLQTNWDKHGSVTYQIISTTQQNNSKDQNALNLPSKTFTVDNGIIKSGDHFGRTIISITNVETYNVKQTLTVIVDVKPIHYMMLSLHSKLRIRNGEELNMLPKGMELDYIVEYYDNVGMKFHAADTNVKTTLNRVDLATFTTNPGNLITTKFIENGELVVKIFSDKYPQGMFDYVHMRLGDIVFPTKTTLTVGDIVCFSMPLLSPDGDPGYWQSTAPDILIIDPITGIARARNIGHAIVKHSLASHMQGEIEVTIQAISKVSIVPLRGKNVTGFEVFSVPLVLKSKDEQIKENNVLSRGLGGCRTYSSFALTSFPYTCNIILVPSSSIGAKDMFLVKPRFSIVTGFYYCDIIPMGSPNVALSTLEARIQISARSRDIEAVPLELTYLPPIYVSTKEILFVNPHSQTVPIATLDIFGLRSVLEHVTVEVPDGITISGQLISKSGIQYRLRLMNNQDDVQGQKIMIANELTKQNISLFIRISKYDHFMPFSGIQWVDYVYFHRYTFGTFAVIVITCFYIWKNKVTNVDLTIKNKSVFADKCPPPIRKTSTPYSTTMNTSNMSSPRSPTSPLRPFSAFEPVYGDPRGLFTPSVRRNRTLN